MLITGLRIIGGALFLGAAGFGSLVTEGFGGLDTDEDADEEDLGVTVVAEEEPVVPPVFGCTVAFFSGSDLRAVTAFFLFSDDDLLAAAAAAFRLESLLLPSPRPSTPCTGSSPSEPDFIAIKGMSTSFSDFSISARLALQ